jgi:signal transduction histidine kinase
VSEDDASAARRLRHDLRTPLTIVTGFAEILAADRPVSDEDRRDYAQRIVAAADEIRELLDAAKLAGE